MLAINTVEAAEVFQQQSNNLTLNPSDPALDVESNYTANEDIYGAYAMETYKQDKLFAEAGVRFEATKFETGSFESQTIGTVQTWVPVTDSSYYTNLLPSANVVYDVASDVKLRAAFSHSLSRPDYSSVARTETYNNNEDGTISITEGNPALKPRESYNSDLAAE